MNPRLSILSALLLLLPTLGLLPYVARARTAGAFCQSLDGGQVAGTVGYLHADWLDTGTGLLPFVRPAGHGQVVLGLPGVLDLRGDLIVGGSPWAGSIVHEALVLDATGGLRLAPFGEDRSTRFAISLMGGIRDAPPFCCYLLFPSSERNWGRSTFAVAVTRVEGQLEFVYPSKSWALLMRFRYDLYWVAIERMVHAEEVSSSSWPVADSMLWEYRLGARGNAASHVTPFFEVGVHLYKLSELEDYEGCHPYYEIPCWVDDVNVGLIGVVGFAWSSR